MELGLSGFGWIAWIFGWILVLCCLGVFWLGHKLRRRDIEKFGDVSIIYRMFANDIWQYTHDAEKAENGDQSLRIKRIRQALRRRRNLKIFLYVFAMLLIVIAMGKPRWGTRQEEVNKQGIDIVLAVDTSLSMKAEDIAPNRMTKAKSEIIAFLKELENNRVALVGFASTTRLHCPLTLDFRGMKSILNHSLSYGIGTNLENAVKESVRVFTNSKAQSKVIILLSDGEGHEGTLDKAINMAKSAGIAIYCIGIGTTEGGPIPEVTEEGLAGYKKDKGELVWTKLNEDNLMKLAAKTNGYYFRASDAETEAKYVADKIKQLEKTEFSQTYTTRKEEQFTIFLILAIYLLAVEAVLGDYGILRWEE
ncbi:VWA domain-containing protein [bacterium]|nr:VWA domain-containing protein [candidate division CSSED10-310 bacterium]